MCGSEAGGSAMVTSSMAALMSMQILLSFQDSDLLISRQEDKLGLKEMQTLPRTHTHTPTSMFLSFFIFVENLQ